MTHEIVDIETNATPEQLDKIKASFEAQKIKTQQDFIKRMLHGAKAINLELLDDIMRENDQVPFFAPQEYDDAAHKTGQALEALKEFCLKIRSIK